MTFASNWSQQHVCKRQCCLNNEDTCVGCFRTLDEILAWHSMRIAQKQATLIKCQIRKANIDYAKKDCNRR